MTSRLKQHHPLRRSEGSRLTDPQKQKTEKTVKQHVSYHRERPLGVYTFVSEIKRNKQLKLNGQTAFDRLLLSHNNVKTFVAEHGIQLAHHAFLYNPGSILRYRTQLEFIERLR